MRIQLIILTFLLCSCSTSGLFAPETEKSETISGGTRSEKTYTQQEHAGLKAGKSSTTDSNPTSRLSARALTAKVRRALMNTERLSFLAQNIRIDVSRNKVMLSGAVTSLNEKQHVIRLAEREAEDRTVEANLSIQQNSWF